MRPAMPSSRPSSCANGLASLSGSDSTARMIAASAASCASSFATVSSSRSASTLTSVRSGSSDSRLRIVPSASRAARRAWISSSESKTCCCSLSRISAARLSMPRMRSNDMAVSALIGNGASCSAGRGADRKCSDTGGSPTRRVPVRLWHPRSEQSCPPKRTWSALARCSTVTACPSPPDLVDTHPGRPEGAPPRPPGRRTAARHDHRAGRRRRLPRPAVTRPGRAGRVVPRGRPLGLAGAVPGDVRAHRRRHADRRRHSSGWRPSAPRTWPPTGSSTPRCASPRSCTSSAGLSLEAVVEAVLEGFRQARRDGRGERQADPDRLPAHRDAPRRPLPRDRRAGRALPRRRGGRLRHRRRREGLPAHPPSRRVRVRPPAERARHHPRRRGVRAAVDLGGDPVVRRAPARPRRADRRRHHRSTSTANPGWDASPPTSATAGSRWRCARRRTSRRVPLPRSPITRSACSPGCASG